MEGIPGNVDGGQGRLRPVVLARWAWWREAAPAKFKPQLNQRERIMTTTLETTVREKARELCESLIQLPEFEQLRLRIDQFMINDSARSQYEELSEQGEHLHRKQHQGVEPSRDEIDRFEKNRIAFLNNPVARGFMDAQDEAYRMRDLVAKYVTRTFELGRVPAHEDLQEGGCGDGCGCHH